MLNIHDQPNQNRGAMFLRGGKYIFSPRNTQIQRCLPRTVWARFTRNLKFYDL
jgi:hypothetical protein